MATVTPTENGPIGSARVITWADCATGDTINSATLENMQGGVGAVQLSGTWGGATVVLQVSNDGSTWATMKDVNGASISATDDAFHEFSTAGVYIRPSSSGGSSDAVDVVVALRG